MDDILSYLLDEENEYKSRTQILEQEIDHIVSQIASMENSVQDIDEGIDKSYSVFSSSQIANAEQNNEIDALNKMIESSKIKKASLDAELKNTSAKLKNIESLIKTYKTKSIAQKDLKSISSKVKLALKVLDVDRERAIMQLKLALEQLKK